jgi:hypothetical protein
MNHAFSVPALLLIGAMISCSGGRAALRDSGDAPLINEEEGLRDPPARGTSKPPPTYLEDPQASPPPPQDTSPRAPDAEPPPAPLATDQDAASAPGSRIPYAGPKGTIRRTDLVSFLEHRPAAFLRMVDSEPHLENGRFRGWTIRSFFPGDPRFSSIDLKRGDVVTRVNGRSIERPDQFIQVWEDLRQARELRVELLRNGQPHVSRWTIID